MERKEFKTYIYNNDKPSTSEDNDNNIIPTNLNRKKQRDECLNDDYDIEMNSHTKYVTKTKYPNRKKILQKQLEFYFSDANLINDKYLRLLLAIDSKGVDIKVLLDFNKIKEILYDINSIEAKQSVIKQACDVSKVIYISKNKIQRYHKFNLNTIDQSKIDDCTLYIENLPSNTTHDIIEKVFNQWEVNYISIPKYKTKECKGYAFVTFIRKEDANEAMNKLNNSLPKEISNMLPKELNFLKIITKEEWLRNKAHFKELKMELQKINKAKFISCIDGQIGVEEGNKSNEEFKKGTLVKLSVPADEVTIQDIKIFSSNIIPPVYVDYVKGNHNAVLRFAQKIYSDTFIQKIKQEDYYIKGMKITAELMKGKEEDDYLQKIKTLKEEYQKQKQEKIIKNNKTK